MGEEERSVRHGLNMYTEVSRILLPNTKIKFCDESSNQILGLCDNNSVVIIRYENDTSVSEGA